MADEGRIGRPWTRTAVALAAAVPVLGTMSAFGTQLDGVAAEFGGATTDGALAISLSTLVQFGVGTVVGTSADRHGPRRVLLVAALAYGLGVAVAASSPSRLPAMLALGLGTGLAGGCVLTPLLALVTRWFRGARPLAVGLMSAAGSIGGLLLSPVLARGVELIGLRATWWLLALGVPPVVTIAAVVLHEPGRAPDGRTSRPWARLAHDPPLRRLYLSVVLMAGVTMTVPVLLVPLAVDHGVPSGTAALLLSGAHLTSILVRLLGTPWVRPPATFRTYQGAHLLTASAFLVWAAAPHDTVALTIAVMTYGAGSGAFAALAPTLVAAATDPREVGATLGLLFTAPAVGGAVGPLAVSAASAGLGPTVALLLVAATAVVAALVLRPLGPVRQSSSARRSAARSAPSVATGRYSTVRPISEAIASASRSGSASS